MEQFAEAANTECMAVEVRKARALFDAVARPIAAELASMIGVLNEEARDDLDAKATSTSTRTHCTFCRWIQLPRLCRSIASNGNECVFEIDTANLLSAESARHRTSANAKSGDAAMMRFPRSMRWCQ